MLEVGATADAGVGEEQVDRSERRLGLLDQRDVAGLGRDVGLHTEALRELVGDRFDVLQVGHDDAATPAWNAGRGPADATRRTRDDDLGGST